eukprot:ANDGO_06101.mRNA.1 hypothetical protein
MSARLFFLACFVGVLFYCTRHCVHAVTWSVVGTGASASPGNANQVRLAIDSKDQVYLAFKDDGVGGTARASVMKLDKRNSWGYVGSRAFSTAINYNWYCFSLGIDRTDVPHILFRSYSGDDQAISMRYNSTTTSWEYVGPTNFTPVSISFAYAILFSLTNVPYAFFTTQATTQAMAMKYSNNVWSILGTVTQFSPGYALNPAAAMDSNGTPYILFGDYVSSTNSRASVMKLNSSNEWALVGQRQFTPTSTSSTYMDIQIHPITNYPYIAYRGDDTVGNKLTVMCFNGTEWSLVGGSAGISNGSVENIAMRFNSNGTLYAVFRDASASNKLSMLTWNGTAWSQFGTPGFSPTTTNSATAPIGIVISSKGDIYVSYTNSDNAAMVLTTASLSTPSCPSGTYMLPSGACELCPAGSYYNSSGQQSNCTLCPSGTFSAAVGANSSTTCSLCGAGSFGNSTGGTSASSCYLCPAGSFSAVDGATSCTLCAAGTYSNVSGASSAMACFAYPAGSFSLASGSATCQLCAAGTFGNTTGASSASSCFECAAGSYATLDGSATCTLCDAGTYSTVPGAANISVCVSCSPGSYSTVAGASQCTLCSAGTSNSASGSANSSACTPCSAGSYSTTPGSNSCTLCSSGTYNPNTSTTTNASCLLCPAGTYNPNNGSTNAAACIPCAVNSYSSSSGSAICTACSTGQCASTTGLTSCAACTCAPGQYRLGTTSCAQCPAGTWQNLPDQTSCNFCPIGLASSAVGAANFSVCTPCNPGTYPVFGSASCVPCYPGWFAPGFGNGGCGPCPPGTYIGAYASEVCDACSAGTFSNTASPFCMTCPSGTFSVDRAPRCNVYNVSESSLSPSEMALLSSDWQCTSRQLSSANASLVVYAIWNRQAVNVDAFASCNVSTFETLPTASTKGESLNLALNVTTLTSASSWFQQNAKCFVCMRGSAAGSVWVALSETEVVAENSETPVGVITHGQPKFVSTPPFAAPGARIVEITLIVTGGTVDAYLSTSNPSPSASSWDVMQHIESATARLSILASGPVYIGLFNPTALSPAPVLLHTVRNSGSQPTVAVSFTLRSSSSTSSSDESGSETLTSGDIAAIVVVPVLSVVAVVSGVLLWRRHKNSPQVLSPDVEVVCMRTSDTEFALANTTDSERLRTVDPSSIVMETEAPAQKLEIFGEHTEVVVSGTDHQAVEKLGGVNEKQ